MGFKPVIAMMIRGLVAVLTLAEVAIAQESTAPEGSGQAIVSVVTEGLSNPFSVTIEPGTDRVIVAESGAQRIVEIKDGNIIELAADFPESQFRGYKAGPISVVSAGESAMLVGHEDRDGAAALTLLLRDFESDEEEGPEFERQTVTIEGDEEAKLGPLAQVMLKQSLVYVVTQGDSENGWLALGEIENKKLTPVSPAIATTRDSACESPTSIAVSPGGAYLVVSQMGKPKDVHDSHLVFYSLQGKMLSDFQVDLNDIVAIAYGPNREHLFAIDYHFADPQQAGIYKIIADGAKSCTVKKVADVSYATSMAFDGSGTLWVTSLGGPPGKEGKPSGKLFKIEGLDEAIEIDQKPVSQGGES